MSEEAKVPTGGATDARTLQAFKAETKALLEARGIAPRKATSLVHRHRADVRRAWSKSQPPCAATDKIVEEEERGMHGKRDPAWWGTEHVEKQATLWHNRLVHIILYGIDVRGRENLAEADSALASLLEQKVPGNQKHRTARWWEHKKASLRRMWTEAVEVAQGVRAPKLGGTRKDPKRKKAMKKKSAKFERCVKDVKRSGTAKNPWAVCHAALGKKAFTKRDPNTKTETAEWARRRQELYGVRVELGPWTDRWMMGDRYGTIVKVSKDGKKLSVKMDRSGKTLHLTDASISQWHISPRDRSVAALRKRGRKRSRRDLASFAIGAAAGATGLYAGARYAAQKKEEREDAEVRAWEREARRERRLEELKREVGVRDPKRGSAYRKRRGPPLAVGRQPFLPFKPDVTISRVTPGVEAMRPRSPRAKAWFKRHIGPDARWNKGALLVEGRYVDDIIEGLMQSGMWVEGE